MVRVRCTAGKGHPNWWAKFHVGGSPIYASTKTKDKTEAKRYLRRRLGEVATGQFVSLKTEHLTIADLCQLVIEDYVDNQYRSLPDLRRKIQQHIEPIVGRERFSLARATSNATYLVVSAKVLRPQQSTGS